MVRRILPEEVDLHQRTAPVAGALGRFNKFVGSLYPGKIIGLHDACAFFRWEDLDI